LQSLGDWLSKTYGVLAVATLRGKVHDYLGMIFYFLVDGKVMESMIKYIKTSLPNSRKKSWQFRQAQLQTIFLW
jgi:hypothetical protein